MASRLELHEKLCELLGSRNVYYQPPATVKMKYPAIVYRRYAIDNVHADNIPYFRFHGYEITVIDKKVYNCNLRIRRKSHGSYCMG